MQQSVQSSLKVLEEVDPAGLWQLGLLVGGTWSLAEACHRAE